MKKLIYLLILLLFVACGDKAEYGTAGNPPCENSEHCEDSEFIFQVKCYSGDACIYGPVYIKEMRKKGFGVWDLKGLNDKWITIFGDCVADN